MRTHPGELLGHDDRFEPVIGSAPVSQPGRLPFIQRARRRRLKTPLKHLHPRGHVVKTPGSQARQAVVKVWQASARTTSQHLSYLTRDGKGGEARQAELFTEDGRAVDRKAFGRAAKYDPVQHRVVIAVPDHARVDLQRLTRAFMDHVQTQALHARVDWLAAIHRDTSHPHIHLVLRGIDADGRSVYFTKDYLLRSMRYQVQNILTVWLGRTAQRTDLEALEAWMEAHVKESMTMQAPAPEPVPEAPPPSAVEQAPRRPRTLTREEAQRRIEETRLRMQQVIARLQARHHNPTRAREVDPEALQHRPGEPEHSQTPDQQATPRRGMER